MRGKRKGTCGAFTGASLAWFALGCAPLANLRPPSALEGEPNYEMGAGIATLGPRPYVEESTRAAGQVWGSIEAKRWLNLTSILAFDDSAAAGGVGILVKPVRTSRFVAGTEAELGFAWAALSLPAAIRLFDETWLYAAPRLSTWSDQLGFGVPVGASFMSGSGFGLRAEAQLSWAEFVYYNRRLHLAAAAFYSW